MRAALPDDLPVLEVRLVDDKHPAPMAQVRAADYDIELSGETAQATIDAVDTFMSRDSVMAMRKTKSGEKNVDIRPLAYAIEKKQGGLSVRLKLTEMDTLKPDLLVNTLAEMADVDAPEMRIHRRTLFGEDAGGELKPLMEL